MNCVYCHNEIERDYNLINIFLQPSCLCDGCLSELMELKIDESFQFHDMNVVTLYEYERIVKRMIRRYKFLGDVALEKVFSMFVKEKIRLYDKVIPVPISKLRLKERGFNQVTRILDDAGVKYDDILTSHRTMRQSQLSKYERETEVNPFSMREDIDLKNQSIIIVDDIFTTGETVRQVSEILKAHNPKRIDVLTFSISRKL